MTLVSNPHRLGFEKGVFLLAEHFPESIVRGLPLRAVLVPRVTGFPATTLRQGSPAQSLMAVAPSTLLQLSATRESSMRMMSAFVQAVPNFVLELGTDFAAIPGVLRSLLKELAP